MNNIFKILPLLLLAAVLNLSSCVNEPKNPVKTQVQDTTKGKDTLTKLAIIYSIPDSNDILTVHFHAVMTPVWEKNYRLDWNFGDNTGIISRFDTSNLTHYFQKYGTYSITLNIFDTVSKTVLGKTLIQLKLLDNPVDTNYLHSFYGFDMIFTGVRQYDTGKTVTNLDMPSFSLYGNSSNTKLQWSGTSFIMTGTNTYGSVSKPDPNNQNTWYYYSGTENFEIRGKISHTGHEIDSGSYIYNYDLLTTFPHGRQEDRSSKDVEYQSLPFKSKDSSKMVFSFQGTNLNRIISKFIDKGLIGILWDELPIPTLTITFYR